MSNSTRIRPKYQLYSELTPNIVIDEIKSLLTTKENVVGRILGSNVYLRLPDEEQHYWSPVFQVKIGNAENGASIKGIIGPNPKVWATFMVFYGLAIMLLIFGGSLGISQWMLGMESIWIWSVPVSIILFVLIFVAAKYGQRLGADQLIRLRYFLDEAIDNAEKRQSVIHQEP